MYFAVCLTRGTRQRVSRVSWIKTHGKVPPSIPIRSASPLSPLSLALSRALSLSLLSLSPPHFMAGPSGDHQRQPDPAARTSPSTSRTRRRPARPPAPAGEGHPRQRRRGQIRPRRGRIRPRRVAARADPARRRRRCPPLRPRPRRILAERADLEAAESSPPSTAASCPPSAAPARADPAARLRSG